MTIELAEKVEPIPCKKCGGEMRKGIGMLQTWTRGLPDFAGSYDSDICTMSAGGPGKIIPCMKCSKCGWSVRV